MLSPTVVFSMDVHTLKRPATPRPPLTCVILNHWLASTRFHHHHHHHHCHHHHCQLPSINEGAGGKHYCVRVVVEGEMLVWIYLVELLTKCPPPPLPPPPPHPPPFPPSLPPFPHPPSPPTVAFDFNGLHRGTDAHTTASEAPKQVCGTMANQWAPSWPLHVLIIIVSPQHV